MARTRILWIDNEFNSISYLLDRLRKDYGVEVYYTDENRKALEMIKLRSYEAVLYDIGMDLPDRIDGSLPVASKLREAINGALFIGTSRVPRGFHINKLDYFDEIVQVVGYLDPIIDILSSRGVKLPKPSNN